MAGQQARAAAEAAKAAAASGPSEHQQDMFQVEAILKAEVRDLEERYAAYHGGVSSPRILV